ncbi:hypothetical protein ES708_08919 [subsurface metagenome]
MADEAPPPIVPANVAFVKAQIDWSGPAYTVASQLHSIVLVSVGSVPAHAPLPVNVIVAVKLPKLTDGVNVAWAGSMSCDHDPSPSPPDQSAALNVPVAVAPVINMGAVGVTSQRVMAPPAPTTGVSPQLIVRVLVGSVPAHVPLPVTVSVAVKLPLPTVGIKIANAGFMFCDHVPKPPSPDQSAALNVPVAVAPVIKRGSVDVSLHRMISDPASAVGVCAQLIVLVSVSRTPPHEAVPVTVSVAVKLPLLTDGENVARAGFASCIQVPGPATSDHIAELYVPPAVAPVIKIGSVGVALHLLIANPASAVGKASTVKRAGSDLNGQPPCPGGVFISTR